MYITIHPVSCHYGHYSSIYALLSSTHEAHDMNCNNYSSPHGDALPDRFVLALADAWRSTIRILEHTALPLRRPIFILGKAQLRLVIKPAFEFRAALPKQ